jgi:hypothetical protein
MSIRGQFGRASRIFVLGLIGCLIPSNSGHADAGPNNLDLDFQRVTRRVVILNFVVPTTAQAREGEIEANLVLPSGAIVARVSARGIFSNAAGGIGGKLEGSCAALIDDSVSVVVVRTSLAPSSRKRPSVVLTATEVRDFDIQYTEFVAHVVNVQTTPLVAIVRFLDFTRSGIRGSLDISIQAGSQERVSCQTCGHRPSSTHRPKEAERRSPSTLSSP